MHSASERMGTLADGPKADSGCDPANEREIRKPAGTSMRECSQHTWQEGSGCRTPVCPLSGAVRGVINSPKDTDEIFSFDLKTSTPKSSVVHFIRITVAESHL